MNTIINILIKMLFIAKIALGISFLLSILGMVFPSIIRSGATWDAHERKLVIFPTWQGWVVRAYLFLLIGGLTLTVLVSIVAGVVGLFL